MPLILASNDGEIWAVMVMVMGVAMFTAIYMIFKARAESHRRTRFAELRAQGIENEARLKSLMIQRGMSGEEIERVLASGANSAATDLDDPDEAEGRIVKILAGEGYNGDDTERVLRAARRSGRIDGGAVRIVETMAENWKKAHDIERVLRSRPTGSAKA